MILDDEKKSAIGLIRKIIVHETELDEDRVTIYNQKYNIPNDDDIFVTLSFSGAKVLSNKAVVLNSVAGFTEKSDMVAQESIEINVMSRNEDALFQKHKVLMALVSNYSQELQEANSFKIARIPTQFLDVSEVEATARLNRYSITVAVFAWYHLEKTIDYYGAFNGVVDTESIEKNFVQNTQ